MSKFLRKHNQSSWGIWLCMNTKCYFYVLSLFKETQGCLKKIEVCSIHSFWDGLALNNVYILLWRLQCLGLIYLSGWCYRPRILCWRLVQLFAKSIANRKPSLPACYMLICRTKLVWKGCRYLGHLTAVVKYKLTGKLLTSLV